MPDTLIAALRRPKSAKKVVDKEGIVRPPTGYLDGLESYEVAVIMLHTNTTI